MLPCVLNSYGPRFSPTLPLLNHIHWLPVVYWIKFNLDTVTYRAFSAQQLTDSVNLLHFSYTSRSIDNLFLNNFLFRKLQYLQMCVLCGCINYLESAPSSSSSPFPTRWGQRPEFLISRMFCPGHPPGWSAVPSYPFGRNPSISLLFSPFVFFLALSCQQLLSLRCFLHNQLPIKIKSSETIATFKKTYLFKKHFHQWWLLALPVYDYT